MRIMRNVGPTTDLDVLCPHITALVEENFHAEAGIAVAKFSGRQDIVDALIKLKRLRDKQGSMRFDQLEERDNLEKQALAHIEATQGKAVRDRLYGAM